MGEEGDGKRERRVTATPDHPPYSEMVQVALRSLAEAEGSTASSISSFIVSAYPSLPPAHSNFLPYYLRKLLLSADIVTHHHHHPPRFSLPPTPTPTTMTHVRPPLKYNSIQEPSAAHMNTNSVTRGRGRPPLKYDSIQEPCVSVTTDTNTTPMPRGRGRPPRKYDSIQKPSVSVTTDTSTRPRQKLILHLRRRNGDVEGGAGAGWLLLRAAGGSDDEGRGSSSPLVEVPHPPPPAATTLLLPDAESANKPEDMYR